MGMANSFGLKLIHEAFYRKSKTYITKLAIISKTLNEGKLYDYSTPRTLTSESIWTESRNIRFDAL